MSKNWLIIIIIAALAVGGCVWAYVEMSDEEDSDDDTMEVETETTPETSAPTDSTMNEDEDNTSDTTSDTDSEYADIGPQEAYALIESNPMIVVLDVSPNYEQGHLPGAINHYVGDGSLDDAIPTLDKTKMYLVYCHNDSASISGAQKLIDVGFKMVYRLKGNYSAWVDAGLPIEK